MRDNVYRRELEALKLGLVSEMMDATLLLTSPSLKPESEAYYRAKNSVLEEVLVMIHSAIMRAEWRSSNDEFHKIVQAFYNSEDDPALD